MKNEYYKMIQLLNNYKKIYTDMYNNANDKSSRAVIDLKENIDALERTIKIIKSEANWQTEQEIHSQITIEMEQGKEISLVEWAEKNKISPDTARQKANRGMFKTARKIGRNWVINEFEQNNDNRKK